MRINLTNRLFSISLIASIALFAVGCGQKASDTGANTEQTPVASEGHDLAGWWCNEHGIPEEDCSMCSSTAAAKFKEKGDWCEEHNRAESQCFKCDPTRADKFAKLYEAKAGKKPPARNDG